MRSIRMTFLLPGLAVAAATATVSAGLLVSTLSDSAQVAAAGSRAGAPAAKTFKVPYDKTLKWHAAALKRCVSIRLSGTMSYRLITDRSYYVDLYTDPAIHQPEMAIRTTPCGGAKKATVSGAKLTQAWYDDECRVVPSIAASNWFIGVGVSTACSVKSAVRADSWRIVDDDYVQSNSGIAAVTWKRRESTQSTRSGPNVQTYPLCLGVSPAVTIYQANRSASWSRKNHQICVKPAS